MQYPPSRPLVSELPPIPTSTLKPQPEDRAKTNSWIISADGDQLFPKYTKPEVTHVPPSLATTRMLTTSATALTAKTETTQLSPVTTVNSLLDIESNSGMNNFPISGPKAGAELKRRMEHTVPPEFLPIPKSVTSENPLSRRYLDLDLLPLDPTEVSAVIQPEDTINKTKLFAVIGTPIRSNPPTTHSLSCLQFSCDNSRSLL